MKFQQFVATINYSNIEYELEFDFERSIFVPRGHILLLISQLLNK